MTKNTKFPLYLPQASGQKHKDLKVVTLHLNDGITKVAYFQTEGLQLHLLSKADYVTENFGETSEIYYRFLEDKNITEIDKVAIVIPAPIINDEAYSERLDWTVNLQEVKSKIKVEEVCLINDLKAYAYGLVDYAQKDLMPINTSDVSTLGNVAVLSAGNGLGEAGLFYDGAYLRPFATEGGHSPFAPRTNVEVEFYQYLHKIYGIVSWELVLSKEGLFNIFRFLRDMQGHRPSEKLMKRINDGDFVEALYQTAIEDKEEICTVAINTYLEFLAREANSLVLKLKATGGLIIGGSLPRLFQNYIDKDRFYHKFLASDKMERLLKNIPIYLVAEDDLELKGATYFAAYK